MLLLNKLKNLWGVGLVVAAFALFIYALNYTPEYKIQKMKLTFLPGFQSIGLNYYLPHKDFYTSVDDILKSGQPVLLTKKISLYKDNVKLEDVQQLYLLRFSLLDNTYLLTDKQIDLTVPISANGFAQEVLGVHRLWLKAKMEKIQGQYRLEVEHSMKPVTEDDTLLANLYMWQMSQAFKAEGTYEVLD